MRDIFFALYRDFPDKDRVRGAGEILEEEAMPLPQDIRPVFQDIQDTLVRSEAPWIEQSPMSKVKVLWVGRETGTWASLHHWKKGYVAPPHKHLAGAHAYVLSGKLQVRDGVLECRRLRL